MTKRWDIATIGEIYIDHVFSGLPDWPLPGEEVFAPNYLCELGGGAAITSCATALLGRRTAVFGVVGRGESAWIDRLFQSFGVSTQGVEIVDAASGVTVSVSVTHERSFYTYWGANQRVTGYLHSGEVAAALQQASHVHIAAPLERAVAESLLPQLKQAGCSVSIDVGWQPGWYKDPANLDTCREVDYFLPNEKEARLLTGRVDPQDVLERLSEMGMANAIVKLGAAGAMALEDGQVLTVKSPAVDVVDTTGAGDAFDAGMIDAVLDYPCRDQTDMKKVLRRACACGSLSTRTAGALRGLATREELKAYE